MTDTQTLTLQEATFLIVAVVATATAALLNALKQIGQSIGIAEPVILDLWVMMGVFFAMAIVAMATLWEERTGHYPFAGFTRRLLGGEPDG